jgi:hypothetical protein
VVSLKPRVALRLRARFPSDLPPENGGSADQVCSKFFQLAGKFNRLLNIPGAIDPI